MAGNVKPVDPVKNSERFFDCKPITDSKGNPVVATQVSAEEFWGSDGKDKRKYPLRRKGRKGLRS